MSLVLQSVQLKEKSKKLHPESTFSSKTYMDLFDGAVWTTYTNQNSFNLEIELCGNAEITLYAWAKKGERKISSKTINHFKMRKTSFEFEVSEDEAVYFQLKAIDEVEISHIQYSLDSVDDLNKINLSVIICTYKRKQQVMANIERLKSSLFFEPTSEYYQKIHIYVVDNASELQKKDEAYCKVFHNPNTGGSGGFTRGIVESRKDVEKNGTTHVVFMDDDVGFINETFYRLYALLSLVSKKYADNPVAGRMFRMDQRDIQYTAAEIWNKGDLRHVGFNQDMRDKKNWLSMNKELGEYSGWWFACFPIEFVKVNLPLPFFIHCDDVEYGLRCGKSPLLLNGIQVWHETYESRQDATILYYDIRNTIITNVVRGLYATPKEVIKAFNLKVLYSLKARKFTSSYAMIVAFKDYLKGKTAFVENQNKKTIVNHNVLVGLLLTVVMLPALQIENVIKGNKAFWSYKQLLEK